MSRANPVRFTSLILALGGIAGVSFAQEVLSAQSGTVHFTEGKVFVDGRELNQKRGQFATLRPGQELRTESGRAEVLLTPGAFLRVSNHSRVRMLANQLSDTRIEVLEGSVIAECDALLKDNAITLLYAGNTIRLAKHGLYRVDTAPAYLLVYDGVAIVQSANRQLTLKRGKETSLNGALLAEKFDRKRGDTFDVWDANRSALLASASAGASQALLNSKSSWNANGWYWNSSYGAYTFVPGGGSVYSPFGWQFWSPTTMSYYYVPNSGNRGSSWNNGQSASGGSTTATGGIPASTGGPAGRASSGGGPSFGGGGGGFGGGGFGGGMSSGGGSRGGGSIGGGGGGVSAPSGGHGR